MDAILVPGGFGERGIEGKIAGGALSRASNGMPYLGICLGMQLAVIEFARNVLGLAERAQHRVQPRHAASGDRADHRVAGPARGAQTARRRARNSAAPCGSARRKCSSAPGTLARELYGRDVIMRAPPPPLRVQQQLPRAATARAGLRFSGFSRDGLVEIIELPAHPWFVATQFHPEFTSTPRDGHPLFTGFVRAARACRARAQLPAAAASA